MVHLFIICFFLFLGGFWGFFSRNVPLYPSLQTYLKSIGTKLLKEETEILTGYFHHFIIDLTK